MNKFVLILAVSLVGFAANAQSSYDKQPNERIWGSDENTALEDADWNQVIRSCQYWVDNKENSQINPHAQNISCKLTTNGIEQVRVVEREKTYVTDSNLEAGSSNGKGNQRSERSQRKPRVDTVKIMCPVIQPVQRKYRFDFSVSCEDVAKGIWHSKIQLCEDRWLSQFSNIQDPAEMRNALEPYLVDKICTGDEIIDCSTK